MRLSKFTIQGFRSIIGINSFELVDTSVTTFIGANGSGKSNILKAIASLKGDETIPTNDDHHARDADEHEIKIEAVFLFEEKDKALLSGQELALADIKGFRVTVDKTLHDTANMEFEPIDYKDRRKERYEKANRELMRAIKELPEEETSKAIKAEALDLVRSPALTIWGVDTESVVGEFNLNALKAAFPTEAPKLEPLIAVLRGSVKDSVGAKLQHIFNSLDIELLTLESYRIENKAPIAELADGSQHPFLYDLLVLARKKAADFAPNGSTALARATKKASEDLSVAISNVWRSHNLRFEIDRQGDELVFMVFTPQNQQVFLTDLSDGEQWFLKFYVRLAIAQREGKQVFWLFDEPGRDLHTSSQIDLKEFFEQISKEFQIIYTSHLAMMIPWHRLERIYAVENTQKDGTIVHKRFWSDGSFDSPLKEALSTFVGEELISGKEHVIIEGVSDYFYLQGWLRYLERSSKDAVWQNFDALRRSTIPVDGIDKIPLYCWFLGRKVRKGVNWVVIVDSAKESENLENKFNATGLSSWTDNIQSIGEISGIKSTVHEIEDLFKSREYLSLFTSHYESAYPDCKLPTEEEVDAKLKIQPRLVKALEELLTEKNPEKKTSAGNAITLDKTGIAQLAYKILAQEAKHPFSKETEDKFTKALKNIDKMFQGNSKI